VHLAECALPDRVLTAVQLLLRFVVTAWWYIKTIFRRLTQDDILLLASGIAFNGILTMIPLFLLSASALGVLLNSSELAVARVHDILNALFPPQPFAISIKQTITTVIADIVVHRTSLGVFGILVLLYTATSLFDAVRSALHIVYRVQRTRGVIASFLRHQGFVILAFALFIVSTAVVWSVSVLEGLVQNVSAFSFLKLPSLHAALPTVLIVILTAFMFFIIYRHIPDTQPPRNAALISTITTTVLWVLSGKVFALYLSNFSSIGTIYGPYAFILVLLIWVYYSGLIFVVGAVVGQVHWERTLMLKESDA